MLRKLIVCLGLFTVSACMSQLDNPFVSLNDVLTPKLNLYNGQKVSLLVRRIGYPNDSGIMMDRKFFVWSRSQTHLIPTNFSGGGFGMVGATPFSYSSFNPSFASAQASCYIRVFIDPKGIITSSEYSGNKVGCEDYVNAL